MTSKINPISGFPEYLPAQQRAFDAIVAKVRAAYESFGYTALETAVVERTETLLAKGIDAKEVYGLRRLAAAEGEEGGKASADNLALRFDLTVPTARYVAQNYGQLVFPFRRHQIQPVWRGERPQAGRYRQFHQCDIDYIADGAGALPLAADAEILACAYTALASLGLKFTMRVNNRKLLSGLFLQAGITTPEARYAALKIIDDLEKKPRAASLENLRALTPKAEALLDVLTAKAKVVVDDFTREGLEELQSVLAMAQASVGQAGKGIVADYTIARGLDYYTGTVVETVLHDAPELGSICSGGRYENLAESLSERALPGVGISIGLSRLATWLMTQAPWQQMAATCAEVYVAHGLKDVAAQLRAAGLKVEEGLEPTPQAKQFIKAEKRGHTWAVYLAEGGTVTLRHIPTRKDTASPVAEIAKQVRGG
jgi:histidyl-tRNA synthetase